MGKKKQKDKEVNHGSRTASFVQQMRTSSSRSDLCHAEAAWDFGSETRQQAEPAWKELLVVTRSTSRTELLLRPFD